MTTPDQLRAAVQAWIADEVDQADAAELRALLDAEDWDELGDRFAGPLTFGTAGLRGPLRAGPNGMNRAVVRQAAAGLSEWLLDQGFDGRRVVVGYDARRGSTDFAADSAAILAAAGFEVTLLPRPLPTPVLAYAVQNLQAVAGVQVTASHNPPEDNGYKVYVGDGAQINTPVDAEIESEIRAITSISGIPLSADYTVADDGILDIYVADISRLVEDGPRDLKIVHTALHGVGTETIKRVFAASGFSALLAVDEQAEPDGAFPTVAFPNPEEPGALDLALALAEQSKADLIIANDPDADRCSVAVPLDDGTWRQLRGDEVGVLLADHLLTKGVVGTYATTIVSSSMLKVIAAARGVNYVETLTGFKWISRAAPDLAYGYEEALGYAVAPHLVRDKDGISAALLVAELAAELKDRGSSLLARLEELYERYGRFTTDQLAVRVDDLARIGTMMARLRNTPPESLLGQAVTVEDLLPQTDGIRLTFEGGRVVVRPSGTEPKLKAYLEVQGDPTALPTLKHEMSAALGL
jgi:phosphomannomutase